MQVELGAETSAACSSAISASSAGAKPGRREERPSSRSGVASTAARTRARRCGGQRRCLVDAGATSDLVEQRAEGADPDPIAAPDRAHRLALELRRVVPVGTTSTGSRSSADSSELADRPARPEFGGP